MWEKVQAQRFSSTPGTDSALSSGFLIGYNIDSDRSLSKSNSSAHTHTQKGKTLILVQRHEKIQKSKETIDSNDTLECDDEAHKVVLSTHSHFFWITWTSFYFENIDFKKILLL